jgi:phosphoribosylpyrophosphate synthetase
MNKITNHLLDSINYPVGNFIQKNMNIINEMINSLNKYIPFDEKLVFVCTGSSGAIISSLFCVKYSNSIIFHIKKEGENSHSNGFYDLREALEQNQRKAIIVDDIIVSGNTINRIIYKILENTSIKSIPYIVVTGPVNLDKIEKKNFIENIICKSY